MLFRFFLLFACVFLVHSNVSEARGRRSQGCVGCGTSVRVMPSQGCVGCGTSVRMMPSQGCVGCGTSVRMMPSQGCVGCGTQSQFGPQSSCVGCGTQPGPSFEGGNGNLDLQAAPAPSGDGGTGGTIQVSGRGHNRSGVGADGEALNNVLLMPGQPLAGRGADGVFRDIVINDGRVGFTSNGGWQEFPASTSSQVVSLVKGHSGLSSSTLGRAILGQGGVVSPAPQGEGPAPEGSVPAPQPEGNAPTAGGNPVTLDSQVNGLQFGVAGGKSLNNVLLERGQPIKGRGSDGFFRPIQVRPDGHVGFWGARGWEEFPEATRSDLVSHLQASGRTNEPAFAWLSGGNGSSSGPGPQGSPEGDHGPAEEGPAEPGRPQSTQGTTLASLQPWSPWETLGSLVTKTADGKFLICSGTHGKCRVAGDEAGANEILSKWSKEPAAPADPENLTADEQAQKDQAEQMSRILSTLLDPSADVKDASGHAIAYDENAIAQLLTSKVADLQGLVDALENTIDLDEALSQMLDKMLREATALDADMKRMVTALVFSQRRKYVRQKMEAVAAKIQQNLGTPADPRLKLLVRMITGEKGYLAQTDAMYQEYAARHLGQIGSRDFAGPGCPACDAARNTHIQVVKDYMIHPRGANEQAISHGPIAYQDGKAIAVFFGTDGSLMLRDALTGQPSVVDRTNSEQAEILAATQKYYQDHAGEYSGGDRRKVDGFLAWAGRTPDRAPAQQKVQPQAPQPERTTPVTPQVRLEVYGRTGRCSNCVTFDSLMSQQQVPAGRITHFEWDEQPSSLRNQFNPTGQQLPLVVLRSSSGQVLEYHWGGSAISRVSQLAQKLK